MRHILKSVSLPRSIDKTSGKSESKEMTKKQSDRLEAIQSLRQTLKPGDTVYTVLRSVSRSGMSRDIDLYVIQDSELRWISRIAARAMDATFNEKKDCIKVGGCGMDMGFDLVYNLSR